MSGANGSNGSKPTYRLRDLIQPQPKTMELPDGNVYPLAELDWAGWEAVERMERGEIAATEIFREAAKVLPSVPEPVMRSLHLADACVILAKAAESVKRVAENPPPNSGGETTTTSEHVAASSPSSA